MAKCEHRCHEVTFIGLTQVLWSLRDNYYISDKNDGLSFSRSRSSSMSSLENVSKEAIQCLVFTDSYTRKFGKHSSFLFSLKSTPYSRDGKRLFTFASPEKKIFFACCEISNIFNFTGLIYYQSWLKGQQFWQILLLKMLCDMIKAQFCKIFFFKFNWSQLFSLRQYMWIRRYWFYLTVEYTDKESPYFLWCHVVFCL